ncbi:MAG: 3-hydroxyacyl-[acyl-carrier-protein] dehydratase FabZ [Magnetococcales bacterium]|nr:3-hydroxyacyl-[acyl-carrier-protein] dehydratase FabZ [Magnetococcales bacterium]|tara:strand:+ start:40181 stop:40612 length:432 start_codon:yes stop_codon:yes gene_type:complete
MSQYIVQDLIPHRDPILLVDHITQAEPYKFIKATKKVKEDEEVFKGHFPSHPVWPGVYAIEAIAQTGACLVNLSLEKKAEETIFYFMSVDSAKFRQPIAPGDELELEVTQEKMRGTIFKFAGQVKVAGQIAAEVAFTAKVEDI